MEQEKPSDTKLDIIAKYFRDPKYGIKGINPFWTTIKTMKEIKDAGIGRKDVQYFYRNYQYTDVPRSKTASTLIGSPVIIDIAFSYQADIVFYSYYEIKIAERVRKRIELAQYNFGYTCLLTIVSVRTRRAYAYPMKTKSAQEVADNFMTFLKEQQGFIIKLTTDQGKEFDNNIFNKILKERMIEHDRVPPSTHDTRMGIVERFNGTLRHKLTKFLKSNDTRVWHTALKDILYNYNSTVNTGIGMAPIDLDETTPPRYESLVRNAYVQRKTREVYPIGTMVRVLAEKGEYEKGDDYFLDSKYEVIGFSKYGVFLADENEEPLSRSYLARELRKVDEDWSTPEQPPKPTEVTEPNSPFKPRVSGPLRKEVVELQKEKEKMDSRESRLTL
jgi:hypothetical protein